MTEITRLKFIFSFVNESSFFSKFIQKSSIVKTECRNRRENQETFHVSLLPAKEY